MQDRVSLYPGRVKLIPVTGQENTYDMVRADEPTQEGTPLNADSLLKVATAELYGLGAAAVPDNVLALIKPMIDSNYSELSSLANSKAKIVTGSYAGTNSNANSITFPSLPKFVYITGPSGNWKNAFITVVNGTASYAYESDNSSYSCTPTISGTTISWTARDTSFDAMNYSGNYQWIAIY